ncbi:hypothetical protein AB1L05_10275 [Cytobacillus horneckiae]|uniref:hypothetical protein n=1 Tax=Cytobacillus horneckiae TaxID=549687 RepID=UPI0039A16B35
MNELNKLIAYITKAIDLAWGKFSKDDEKQYKAFMYLLHKANLGVDCSVDRYYEYAVKELLGVRVPIYVL